MIVADSSYVIDYLLSQGTTTGEEQMVAPDLVVYEVANAIFVRERILHLTDSGRRYVSALFKAIDASVIELVDSSEGLMKEAYEIAARNNAAVYDCVFVALSLRSGLHLETRDTRQMKIFELEKARLSGPHPSAAESGD